MKRLCIRHDQLKQPVPYLDLIGLRRPIIYGHLKCPSIIIIDKANGVGHSQRRLVNGGARHEIVSVHRGPLELTTHTEIHQGCRIGRQGLRGCNIQIIPTVRCVIMGLKLIVGELIGRRNFEDNGFHGSCLIKRRTASSNFIMAY